MTTNEQNTPLKRWLTIEDLESEYSFSRIKQYRLRRLKLIPFSKVGKNIRYNRILIDQWLEDNAVGVQA